MTFHNIPRGQVYTQHVTITDRSGQINCHQRGVELREMATAAAEELHSIGSVRFTYVHARDKIIAMLTLRPIETDFGNVTIRYLSSKEFHLYTEIERIIKQEIRAPGVISYCFFNNGQRIHKIDRNSITEVSIQLHRPGR